MSKIRLGVSLFIMFGLLSATGAAHKPDTDLCYLDVRTNLYGNAAVPCEYRISFSVNPDGTLVAGPGSTRECSGSAPIDLGAGSGAVGAPSTLLFPYLAGINLNLPSEHAEGRWLEGRVLSIGDRGGASTVTSSTIICSDAPRQ